MELVRQGKKGFGKKRDASGVDGDFAPASAEHIARDGGDVADVPVCQVPVDVLAHLVDLQVNLNAAGAVVKVQKAGLAHVAPAHDAAGDGDVFVFQLVKAVADFLRESGAFAHGDLKRVFSLLLKRRQLLAADPQKLAQVLFVLLFLYRFFGVVAHW